MIEERPFFNRYGNGRLRRPSERTARDRYVRGRSGISEWDDVEWEYRWLRSANKSTGSDPAGGDRSRRKTMIARTGIILFCSLFTLGSCTLYGGGDFQAVFYNPSSKIFATATGSSLEEASRSARESCPGKCIRATWSEDACAALAVAEGDGQCWGGHWAPKIEEAEEKALRTCRKFGCKCKIVWSDCR